MSMRGVKRFFLSRRTVISLICAVGISCVIGSTIPQVARRPPQFFETWKAESPKVYHVIHLLQFDQVYTSIWFFVLVALIACSLTCSVYYQSKTLIRSRTPVRREILSRSFKNYRAIKSIHSSEFNVEILFPEIKAVFKARGYRPYLLAEGSKYSIFGKNRWGRWGSVIFHVALLVIIMAALYGLAFQKRGLIQLSPMNTFHGSDKNWQAKRLGVLARTFDLGFQVRLDQFVPTYLENDQVKDLVSRLTIIDDKGEAGKLSLSLGKPIDYKGTKIYQGAYYGYGLGFLLNKEGEKEGVMTSFFLTAPTEKNNPLAAKRHFPTTDYTLDMAFSPDPNQPMFYASLPGVDLTITEKSKERFKGKVLFGQRVQLDKDTLTFAQIQSWTALIFTRDYGMPLVYVGFVLATLGGILMYMFSYKEVHLRIAEEGDHIKLSLGGRTRRYRALFSDEFQAIAERLGEVLGEHGDRTVA